MAAAAYLAPQERLYIWGLLPVKMRDLAIVYVGLEIVLSLTGGGDGIAHMAHAGGAVVGLAYILIDRHARRPKPPPPSLRLPRIEW